MKDQEAQKRQWLAVLAGKRPVFAYATEFGPRYPVLEGMDRCVKLFRPCDLPAFCGYFNGRIGIRASLMEFVAAGYLDDVVRCMAGHHPFRARGLPWPDHILLPVSEGDKDRAGRLLKLSFEDLGMAHGVSAWLNAVVYWQHVFGDRERTRQCLANFRTALLDPAFQFLASAAQLHVWINLLDNREDGRPFLVEALRDLGERPRDTATWKRWLNLAVAFGAEIDDRRWARYCLDQAKASGCPEPRLAITEGVLFPPQAHRKATPLRLPKSESVQDLLTAAYCYRLRQGLHSAMSLCLTRAERLAGNWHDVMRIAGAWLLLADDPRQALRLDKKAETMAQSEDVPEAWAARHCTMFGKTPAIELLLLERVVAARTPDRLIELATIHLDTLGDAKGCRVMLFMAEDLCGSAMDLCGCAEQYVRLLGDRPSARRCLRKAAAHAEDPSHEVLLMTTRMRLFGSVPSFAKGHAGKRASLSRKVAAKGIPGNSLPNNRRRK